MLLMERDTGIEPVSSAWKAEVITTIRIPQINQIDYLTQWSGVEDSNLGRDKPGRFTVCCH